MRAAGTVTGLLVLGTFVIPGAYLPNAETHSAVSVGDMAHPGGPDEETQGSASLTGRIYGPDGKPLPDAEVSLAGSGFWPPRMVRSDGAGRFRWANVPAGVYELSASHGQLASLPLDGILLDPGAQRVFALRLVEGWTLTGEVHDGQTGRSIANAEIHVAAGLLGAYSRDARSDAAGRFEVPGIVGEGSTLYLEAPGYVAVGPLHASSQSPAIEVRMERAASLRGVVVDDRGQPIAGAIVRAFGSNIAALGPVEATDSLGVTAGPVPPISATGTRQVALADAVS
ncbi:MAG: carboxypeptidase regulatory-like domain-containing protein, partial [Polyangiales bacterium]